MHCARAFSAFIIIIIGGVLAAATAAQVMAAAPTAPVVASFERFARYDELPPAVSGSLLLSELGCTACHASRQAGLEPKAGPKLESAGRRLQSKWIAAFLNDPQKVKPGTTMPAVLAHQDEATRERSIAALVAFITSQQSPLPELKATGANPVPHQFWNKGDAQSGARLMHQVGCVGCHEPAADYEGGVTTHSTIDRLLEELEPEDIAKLGLTHATRSVTSVPLPNCFDKYTQQGLTMFLLEPSMVRPAGQMPNMKLRTTEAADIAAYLMAPPNAADNSNSKPAEIAANQPQLRQEGQRLFSQLGCVSCHSASGIQPTAKKARPLARLDAAAKRSCIAETAHPSLPHYAIDKAQRAAVDAAIKAEQAPPPAASPQQAAVAELNLSLMQLNCHACHERNQQGGIAYGRDRFFETNGQADLGDEGRLPPPLTGVGKKLTPAWLKKVLQGTGDVRPHLQIRMPKYPAAEVEPLIPLLATADAALKTARPSASGAHDRALAGVGRAIFNTGCVQCHPIRGEALPSVVGIDVGWIDKRVNRDWFRAFLLNPAALKPRTRMPSFFAEGSVNRDFFDGDVQKQIDALWAYLVDIDQQPLPEKIEEVRRQNFELVPREHPIVLRTFMERAGTHAIAVGFPEQRHFAFDAELVRLSEMWRGRFLDAQGTWNDRFAPNAAPLGTSSVALPKGAEFAHLNSANAAWPGTQTAIATSVPRGSLKFLGYRLDNSKTPEFRYQVGDYTIVDRISPEAHVVDVKPSDPAFAALGLVREFTITLEDGPEPTGTPVRSPGLWFRALAGTKLKVQPGGLTASNEHGMSVTLPRELASVAALRNSRGESEWLLPIPAARETVFRIAYRW